MCSEKKLYYFFFTSFDFTVIIQTFSYAPDIQTGKLGRSGKSRNLLFQANRNGSFSKLKPSRLNPRLKEKVNLNFYFHSSLWCLKRFYEGRKDLHETF